MQLLNVLDPRGSIWTHLGPLDQHLDSRDSLWTLGASIWTLSILMWTPLGSHVEPLGFHSDPWAYVWTLGISADDLLYKSKAGAPCICAVLTV